MKIKYISPVFSQLIGDFDFLIPHFTFEKVMSRRRFDLEKGIRRLMQETYEVPLIKKDGIILTGWTKKIVSLCKEEGVKCSIQNNPIPFLYKKPKLPGVTFFPDQSSLINKALERQRGIIISPTGTGKTVLGSAILSAFPNKKKVFLCHTKTLLQQTTKEMIKFGFNTSMVGDSKQDLSGDVVVAIEKSFFNMMEKMGDKFPTFDVVIVDESHHLSHKGCIYDLILSRMHKTQTRFGLTATEPLSEEAILMCEGLLGPVIGEFSLADAQEKGRISKIKIKLVNSPRPLKSYTLTKYVDIYEAVIVNNQERNKIIAQTMTALNKEGKTCICYIREIEHGQNIIKELRNTPTKFVKGSVTGNLRETIRKDLQEKKLMNVVASSAWTEGVNIPSINAIIIAGGGKSEIELLQKIGRGLRRDTDKEEVLIIDIIDHARYLSEHLAIRLSIYLEKGWL